MDTRDKNDTLINRDTNANPEQADIDRARKESGDKNDKNDYNEKPGEIADTYPAIRREDK